MCTSLTTGELGAAAVTMDDSQFGCSLLLATPDSKSDDPPRNDAKHMSGTMSADSLALSLSMSASQQGNSVLRSISQNRTLTQEANVETQKFHSKDLHTFESILSGVSPAQPSTNSSGLPIKHNVNARIPATPATTKMATEFARNLDMLLQSPLKPPQMVDSPDSLPANAAAISAGELHDSVLASLAQGAAFTPSAPSEHQPQDASFASTKETDAESFRDEPLSFVSDITAGSPGDSSAAGDDAWAWDVPNALTATLDSTPRSSNIGGTPHSASMMGTPDMTLSASSCPKPSLAAAPPGVQQLPTVQDEDTIIDSTDDGSGTSVISSASDGEFVSGAAAEALLQAAEHQFAEEGRFRISKAQLAAAAAGHSASDLSGHLPGGHYLSASHALPTVGSSDSSLMETSPNGSADAGGHFTPYFQQHSEAIGALGDAVSTRRDLSNATAAVRRSSSVSVHRRLATDSPPPRASSSPPTPAPEMFSGVAAASPTPAVRASSRQRGHHTLHAAQHAQAPPLAASSTVHTSPAEPCKPPQPTLASAAAAAEPQAAIQSIGGGVHQAAPPHTGPPAQQPPPACSREPRQLHPGTCQPNQVQPRLLCSLPLRRTMYLPHSCRA